MNTDEKISQRILSMQFQADATIKECMDRFYSLMREFKIKKRTPVYNDKGKIIASKGDNYRWTLYRILFLDQLKNQIEINMIFGIDTGYETPEDLLYDEQN